MGSLFFYDRGEVAVMITRERLEEKQIGIYIIVLLLAAGFRLLMPEFASSLDSTISFIIAILMFSMFSQIPFTSLIKPFENKPFIGALLTVNFIIKPRTPVTSVVG